MARCFGDLKIIHMFHSLALEPGQPYIFKTKTPKLLLVMTSKMDWNPTGLIQVLKLNENPVAAKDFEDDNFQKCYLYYHHIVTEIRYCQVLAGNEN